MSKKMRVIDLTIFDPAEYLKDDAEIAAYLPVVIEEGDAGDLAHALGVAAGQRYGTDCRGNRYWPRGAIQG